MLRKIGMVIATAIICGQAFATAYQTPPSYQSLIGNVFYLKAQSGESVVSLAKRYDLGFNTVASANPTVDMGRYFRPGLSLQIPTQHLLPNLPRQGIIINLPEMRMYYYLNGYVHTYPIGIGKIGKTIPIAKAVITRKATNPEWIPPEDIREFNLEQGIVLPKVMPPGPDNPLGPYAIYMSLPTYLIHSTIFPESVGRRASFGCIRMYKSDIESFFPTIERGIPVTIINAPAKIGWQNNRLYLEAHQPLTEHEESIEAKLPGIVQLISGATKNKLVLIDWQKVAYINKERDGIPHIIGIRLR